MDYSKEDCIAELKKICEEAGKVVTRDYFRANAGIPEKAYIKHFGSFPEFQKAASLKPTRGQQKFLNEIARHAATDPYKALNEQRAGYEGKYLRTNKARFKTALICSDLHDKHCDPFYYRLLMETTKRVQPEYITLGGDILDLSEFGRYTVDPREFDIHGSMLWLDKFLGDLRKNAPNTQIDFVEGNHEQRALRHLTETSPAMVSLLSDYHGWTVPKLLGLDKFEVNYHARADLTAWLKTDIKKELSKNYFIIEDAVMVYHYPGGFDYGIPGVNGHHHKHLVRNGYSPKYGSYEWHQLGAGHLRRASYCAGEKWTTGFILAHIDTLTKRTAFEYIDTTNDHTVIGGKFYYRTENEMVGE